MNFKKYNKFDLSYVPIDSYADSLPLLLNEFIVNQAYNNSDVQYQVFNFFKKFKINQSINFMKIYNNFLSYVNFVTKKIFDFSLYYISHIFIDILFNERKNYISYCLEIYNFSKIYHFCANLIPFFLIISVNSLGIACLYYLMLYNTSFIYIFYMLLTMQFCQYMYFYTLVNVLKKKNVIKIQIVSLLVFLINLLFSLAEDFSYFYLLFPPFFMRVLNNYFYESMFYYSEIEENYILQMSIFLMVWACILIIYLKYSNKIHYSFSKKKYGFINLNPEKDEFNLEIQIENNNTKIIKNINIKREKINLITGDNHSGKSKIIKEITSKLPKSQVLHVFPKEKGFLYNLTLKENVDFFKALQKSPKNNENVPKKINSKTHPNEILLINKEENSVESAPTIINNIENKIIQNIQINKKNINLYKLYILLILVQDANLNKEFVILDQPFNGLSRLECSELIEYLSLFNRTIIISSNFKPDFKNMEIILKTQNFNYIKNNSNSIFSNDSINNDNEDATDFLDNKNSNSSNVQDKNSHEKNKNNNINKEMKKKLLQNLKHAIIFFIIFILSYISIFFNSVNIDNPDFYQNEKTGYNRLSSKSINETLNNIYISDNLYRDSSIFKCMSQSVKFLNATENMDYLNIYFNKSVVFNEHAVLLDINVQKTQNKSYISFFIFSRPIDVFINIQLSAIISDCLVNDLKPRFQIKTNLEIKYIDNDPHFYLIMIIDVQLIFITLIYFIFLTKILDINKDYLKNTLIYSSFILALISIEYYLAQIPLNKSFFIPKLLIYSLCCNLLNYSLKKFSIGLLIANSGCFIIYIYYGIIYFVDFIWKVNISNNELLYWSMYILESISPYNRILLYKPVAFIFMFVFSIKNEIAKIIFEGYQKFFEEKQQNTIISMFSCLLGVIFWSLIYLYLLRSIKLKRKNVSNDFTLKRSNEYFMFNKDSTVKSIIDVHSETCKYLCLDSIKNKNYKNLSYTMKNKVLLTIIGWGYLNDSSSINIINKEQVEMHFDDYTKDHIKNFIENKNSKKEENNN